jgi:hypothetical protein
VAISLVAARGNATLSSVVEDLETVAGAPGGEADALGERGPRRLAHDLEGDARRAVLDDPYGGGAVDHLARRRGEGVVLDLPRRPPARLIVDELQRKRG